MKRIGPPLEAITRRLAETPPDFLDEPRIRTRGQVFVPALVNDLLAKHGARAPLSELRRFEGVDDRNRLALTMIVVWLLADPSMFEVPVPQARLLQALDQTVRDLAAENVAAHYVADPERREELVRLVLKTLELRPAGETEAQATDRLTAISGMERRKLLEASREAEARAKAIREALARQQAEASADKWTRE